MYQFKNDAEAVEWGKSHPASKYSYLNCKVGDEDVILAQTNLAYEDDIYNQCANALEYLAKYLPEKKDNLSSEYADEIQELTDTVIGMFEKAFHVRILHVFEEY